MIFGFKFVNNIDFFFFNVRPVFDSGINHTGS